MIISHCKLHHFPGSRSARALWALHETVGDGFEVERVELFKGQQFTPEYLAKNPNHAVPTLDLTWQDGTRQTIIESTAIVMFLADAFAEKNLAPANAASPARADYNQMMLFAGSWMDMMLWQIRMHTHLLPEDQRDQRTIDLYRSKFTEQALPQIAERLTAQPYICGDTFTAADILVGHNLVWANLYRMGRTDVFSDYVARVGQRPAFQKAFADIGDLFAAKDG